MMEYNYRFAGMEFSFQMPENQHYSDTHRLGIFRVDSVETPYKYRIEIVDSFEAPRGNCIAKRPDFQLFQVGDMRIRYIGSVENTLDGAYIRVESKEKENNIQLLKSKYPERIGAKTLLNSIETEHLLAQKGGFILHCSYIKHNDKAILFTAPSESGKSTQAVLWNELRGAEIINGDRAAVRIDAHKIIAEGIPFAGSSNYCKNESLEIEAIVYLGKSKKTYIDRVKGYKAFSKLWEGISINLWDKNDVEQVSKTVEEIARKIPIFHLQCTPDESAILALETELAKLHPSND